MRVTGDRDHANPVRRVSYTCVIRICPDLAILYVGV